MSFLHIHPVKIKRYATKVTYTFCLGGLSFFMFLVLVMTGVLLMFYYVPSSDAGLPEHEGHSKPASPSASSCATCTAGRRRAWSSPSSCTWAASFTPVPTSRPANSTGSSACCLLVVTFLLSFTGYLLPWDQLAFWAITVGTEIGGAAPDRRPENRLLLRGDFEIGQSTLIRFYTLHVIFLPLVAAFLMAVHFWRIRKDGGISGPL